MKRSELSAKASKPLLAYGYVRDLGESSEAVWYDHSDGGRVKVSYSNSLQRVIWERFGEGNSNPTDVGVGVDALNSFLQEGAPKEAVYRIEHTPSKGNLSQYKVYAPDAKYPVLIGHDEASDSWRGYNYGKDSNNLLADDLYVSVVKRWKNSEKPTGTSDKVLTTVNRQYSGYEGPRFHNSHMPVGLPDKRPPFR